VTLLADRALATAELDPPELLTSTLVKPDRKIEHPRKVREATYVLTLPEGAMPDVPVTSSQSSDRVNEHAIRVNISAGDLKPAPDAETADPKYLAASSMLNRDDPEIKKLVEQALPHDAPSGKPER